MFSSHLANVKQKFELDRSKQEYDKDLQLKRHDDLSSLAPFSLSKASTGPSTTNADKLSAKLSLDSSQTTKSNTHLKTHLTDDCDDEYSAAYTTFSVKPKRIKKVTSRSNTHLGPSNKGIEKRESNDNQHDPPHAGDTNLHDTDDTNPEDDANLNKLDHFHRNSYLALKRKVALYNQIKQGNEPNQDGKHSIDSDTHVAFNNILLPDPDRLVEIVDEFGRDRLVKFSERHMYTGKRRRDSDSSDDSVPQPKRLIFGNHLQTSMFKLDEEKADKIRRNEHDEQWENENATHYDPHWEGFRTRGTGYYKFETGNEALRNQQMENLQAVQKENDGDRDNYKQTRNHRMEYRDKIAERREKIAKLRKQKIDQMQKFVKSKDDL